MRLDLVVSLALTETSSLCETGDIFCQPSLVLKMLIDPKILNYIGPTCSVYYTSFVSREQILLVVRHITYSVNSSCAKCVDQLSKRKVYIMLGLACSICYTSLVDGALILFVAIGIMSTIPVLIYVSPTDHKQIWVECYVKWSIEPC